MTIPKTWTLPKHRFRPGRQSETNHGFSNEATHEEDDARSRGSGFTEGFPNSPLGLSDELVQELKYQNLVEEAT